MLTSWVAKDTGERSVLPWCHNLQGLMVGASCSLEISETVLTKGRNPEETEVLTEETVFIKWRNPEKTEEVMTSDSNSVSNLGVSIKSEDGN